MSGSLGWRLRKFPRLTCSTGALEILAHWGSPSIGQPSHGRDAPRFYGPPVSRVNPFERHRIADYGDLSVNPLSIEDTFRRIEKGLEPVLRAGVRPVCVGGDHSVSLPILRAVAKRHGPVALIQFDAHNKFMAMTTLRLRGRTRLRW